MALPLLAIKVRPKGAAAKAFESGYSATFVDGSAVGPVIGGEACQAKSLAAMEALQIVISPRVGKTVAKGPPAKTAPASAPAKPIPGPAAKPAAKVKPVPRPATKGRVTT